MSLGDYVAQIMGAQSDLKNAADAEVSYRSDVSEEVAARRTSVEGVNLDEELANMMVFQQAYNAAARLMTTVQQMYDTLLEVV
jgi:flagellar hook-associated protein 1 FlgK